MKPRLVISESSQFSAAALARLREVADVTPGELDRPALLAAVRDAEVLWVRLGHQIDAALLAGAPSLRFIASPTTGLDHIDLAEADRRGIRVISLRGETAFLRDVRATAELTLALILDLLRNVPAAVRGVLAGGWDREAYKGREVRGSTVGIVGYGRLGQLVAGYVRALGADVIATDPAGVSGEGVRSVSLDELLSAADIVSLHVNLTDATRGMFGARELSAMKRGARLVNTSRGELLDETALLAALETGQLAGAALDVLADERAVQIAEHPLVRYAREHDNLLITPHIGGCTYESMEKTELFLAERVCAALSAR